MLRLWTKTNKQWFAPDSRLSKAQWVQLITDGSIQGRVIDGTPYIEEDHIASTVILEKAPANDPQNDTLDLLG